MIVPFALAQPQTGLGVGVGLGVEVGSGVGSGVGVAVGTGVGVAVGTGVAVVDTAVSLPELMLELPPDELSLLLVGLGVGVFVLPKVELPPELSSTVTTFEESSEGEGVFVVVAAFSPIFMIGVGVIVVLFSFVVSENDSLKVVSIDAAWFSKPSFWISVTL